MLQQLTDKIRVWAIDKELDTANPDKQVLKLFEEAGELCEGLARNRAEDVQDAIGDVYVVLTILAMQLNLSIENCVEQAYNEIKDRQGEMVNGVFVKESDL